MEETVILNFEVDQGKSESQLKKVEGLILDNRKAQQELTKAYKQGTITQEEYIDENLRLQQNLKKEQDQKRTLTKLLETESNSRNAIRQRVSALVKEYDNLNTATATGIKRADQLEKEIAQLNAQLTKGDKAAGLFKNQIGNYPNKFSGAAKSINVAGVSIGDLTGRIASFANPATAAIGIVTALGAAYANSTAGSKDLAFASTQLSTVIGKLTEDFGRLVAGGSGGGGEGLLSQLTDSYLSLIQFVPAVVALDQFTGDAVSNYIEQLRKAGEEAAKAAERLKDLQISRAFAAGDAKEDERRAELARRIRDDEKKALDERIEASQTIDDLLNRSGERSKIVIQAQIQAIKETTIGYENNRQAQLEVAQLTAEIADKEEEITGKLTENFTARQKLIQAIKDEQFLFQQEIRDANKPGTSSLTGQNVLDPFKLEASGENSDLTGDIIQASKDRQSQFLSELKTVEFTEKQKREFYIETAEIQQQIDKQTFQAALDFAAGLAVLFQEQTAAYKVFASAETILSTYSAATKAYEAAFTPPTAASPALGAAYAGLAIANGLANLAKINGVEFVEGGWTGPGDKYDVAGVVHADEYVVPKSVNNSPAAQPHLAALERMRGGYADGGFVANRNTAPAQQALLMANALKNLPAPVVSVVEVTRQQNRVQARERVSTLRP